MMYKALKLGLFKLLFVEKIKGLWQTSVRK